MRPLLVKAYRVTTSLRAVNVMATSFSAAMFTAKELYPGETILSVLYDPEWDDEEVGA
jgi:hypothetical protein